MSFEVNLIETRHLTLKLDAEDLTSTSVLLFDSRSHHTAAATHDSAPLPLQDSSRSRAPAAIWRAFASLRSRCQPQLRGRKTSGRLPGKPTRDGIGKESDA